MSHSLSPLPPRGRLWVEALLATVLVFIVLGLLALLPFGFKAFDPVKEVLKDFSYTDVYYSKISRAASVDTSLVLVNIGRANRAELAAMVETVGQAQPRVIALDAYFPARADSGTALLKTAIDANRARLVTGEYLYQPNGRVTRFVQSAPGLAGAHTGYLNFVGDDSLDTTIRYVRPFQQMNSSGREYPSWSAAVVQLADPAAYAALRERGREEEVIRYRGDINRFVHFEGTEVLAGAVPAAALRGKIVILGFLGEQIGNKSSLEDLHFTPLNKEQLGRSKPDMYGPIIQANIVSMMLHRDYINTTPLWLELLLAFGLCYLHVVLFMYLSVNHGLWYHPISKVVQFATGALLVYLMIELYAGANRSVSTTLAVLAIVLAVDVLYLYETLAAWLYQKRGIRSYVAHVH
jgi:CHASE2 domain-containing sensor protein